jgi:anaerobic magnesium-protoporphyrin IX monomethyl ester cyclase
MVGATVRYRDPIRVVDEMEHLNTLGFHQINLADDLFTANKRHCLAVCDEILKPRAGGPMDLIRPGGYRLPPDAGKDAPGRMHDGQLRCGIRQSRNAQADQKRHHPGPGRSRRCRHCLDCGIAPHTSFILGLPGETPETLAQTLAFGERLKAMGVNHGYHILAPFPGTDVRERIDEYDLMILSDDWRQYHANRAIIRTTGVSPETMDAIVIDGEQQFDQWLADIGRLREEGRASEATAWPLVRLEHTVVIYDHDDETPHRKKGRLAGGFIGCSGYAPGRPADRPGIR